MRWRDDQRIGPVTPSWLHEPLLHFAMLAALIFAVDSLLTRPADPAMVIAIDETVRANLAKRFRQATRREPMPEELDQMIEGWIKQEIMYREGLALGLDRSDGYIRERVISLVRALTLLGADVDAPTGDELRDYFENHKERYARLRRYDLQHFIIRGSGREAREEAEDLLRSLTAGNDPRGLGRRLLAIRGRSVERLAAIFGDEFPERLASMPVGKWQLAHASRGLHVLRVLAVVPGGIPAFREVRQRVEDDWRQERKLEAAAKRYREMRAHYTIVDRDGSG